MYDSVYILAKTTTLILFSLLVAGPNQKVGIHIVETAGKRIIARTYIAPTMGLELIHGHAEENDLLYCKQIEIHREQYTFVGFKCDNGVYMELKAIYF